MAELKVKIGADGSGFSAALSKLVNESRMTQKELAESSERWAKRERELHGLTAAERRREVSMRGKLEQAQRDNHAAALRRQRAEERAAARERIRDLQTQASIEAATRANRAAMLRKQRLEERGTPKGFLGGLAGGIGGMLNPAAIGASVAAAFSVGSISAFISQVNELTSSILRNSDALGVSTDYFQRWKFATGQVNIKSEEAESGLSKLTEMIGDARSGAESSEAAFKKWGISLTDSNGNAISTEAVLDAIADRMAGISDPALRAAMAVDLFGKKGSKMIPILKDGAQAMREIMAQANVISPGQVKAIDTLTSSWAQFKAAVLADGGKIIGTISKIGELFSTGFKTKAGSLISNQLFGNLPAIVRLIEKLFPEKPTPATPPEPGVTPADQTDKDNLDAAIQRHKEAQMTDEEKLVALQEKLARIQYQAAKLPADSKARLVKETEGYNVATEITELEEKIRRAKEKEQPQDVTDPGMAIKAAGLANVGGFSAGANASNTALISAATQTALNTKAIHQTLSKLLSNSNSGGGGTNPFE